MKNYIENHIQEVTTSIAFLFIILYLAIAASMMHKIEQDRRKLVGECIQKRNDISWCNKIL